MTNCTKCIYYDEFLDSMPKGCAQLEGEEEVETHICPMFPDGIDEDVWDGHKECEHYSSDES